MEAPGFFSLHRCNRPGVRRSYRWTFPGSPPLELLCVCAAGEVIAAPKDAKENPIGNARQRHSFYHMDVHRSHVRGRGCMAQVQRPHFP
ncbi:MAG: hypothetical protein AB7K24_31875 [Gemmataceae bacterium]